MENRYLLFGFDDYYPMGGWDDFKGAYQSIDDARSEGDGMLHDHLEIVDIETLRVVARWEKSRSAWWKAR